MGYLNLWGNELENFILAAYKKKKREFVVSCFP